MPLIQPEGEGPKGLYTAEDTGVDSKRTTAGPGDVSGRAGQVIPGVTRFKDSDRILSASQSRFAPQAMPDVDDASEAAQEQRLGNIEELVRLRGLKKDAPIKNALQRTYFEWWGQNNNESMEQFISDAYGAPASDPALKLPVVFSEDIKNVLQLLETKRPTTVEGKAAKLYFTKIPSVIDVLDLIAYDAAGVIQTTNGTPLQFYTKDKDVSDAENAFFAGTGNANGTRAYNWVQDSLSDTSKR